MFRILKEPTLVWFEGSAVVWTLDISAESEELPCDGYQMKEVLTACEEGRITKVWSGGFFTAGSTLHVGYLCY